MASGYVPPHKRSEPEEKKKTVSLNSRDDFPDLTLKSGKTTAWGSKTSFSQKVKDLIANEQKTEAEREAEREAARAIEGWVVLNIRPFTKERHALYAKRMMGLISFEEFHGQTHVPTVTKEQPIQDNNDSYIEYEEKSEGSYHEEEKYEESYEEPYEEEDAIYENEEIY
jgi:hypothetical protein